MEFAEEGGEAPTPYEVLLLDAMRGDSTRFTRQDGVEETWRIFEPLLEQPPPVHPYAPGSWGPPEADELVRGIRRLARPVGGVVSPAKSGKPETRPEQGSAGAAARRGAAGSQDDTMPQSAAMPSPFPPIADYAFLSDCHTGALVAPDGTIDWLCVPRFDAPSVFGTLLDRQAGGFRFGPFGINVPDGAHLRARDEHPADDLEDPERLGDRARRADLGPRRGVDTITPHTRPPDRRGRRPHARARRDVPGGRGRDGADLRTGLRLRARPGAVDGRATTATAADASGAEQTIRLQTDMAVGVEGDWVRARHVLKQGEQIYCSLSWAEELAAPENIDEANERLAATARFWRGWLGRARIPDHRWRDPIQRSALAIKGLTYMPTGATVAALTTSLPETPGGERNWDYRYTWLRDSTFTLQALHYLNLDWEAEEFMQFVADLEPNERRGAADHVRDRRAARPDRVHAR